MCSRNTPLRETRIGLTMEWPREAASATALHCVFFDCGPILPVIEVQIE